MLKMEQTSILNPNLFHFYSSEKKFRNPLSFCRLPAKPHQSKHLAGARLASYSAGMSQGFIPKGVTKFVKIMVRGETISIDGTGRL